jgi:ribosomal protein S18 acetylase RimI-like enzyme
VTNELSSPVSHIRDLCSPQDLLPVADVIEQCFAATLDEDGRDFIRQLRKAGRAALSEERSPYIREQELYPLRGFVWLDHDQIVGNLSLIPFIFRDHSYHLIANVAVLPQYRNQGIGRALTQHAIDHIRKFGSNEIWLQVREDNPIAQHLYQTLGFQERCRRDTWLLDAHQPLLSMKTSNLVITARRSSDWKSQLEWLENTYPKDVTWNFYLEESRFEPGFWNGLQNLIKANVLHHWAVRRDDRLLGLATWEATRHYADVLWLSVDPEVREIAIDALLQYFRCDFFSIRPIQINYPANEARQAFFDNAFKLQHTLIWMKLASQA